MMVKSGLDLFILKFYYVAPSELLLHSAKIELTWQGQQVTLKGLVEFQNKKRSGPLFTTIFNSKILVSKPEILVHLF